REFHGEKWYFILLEPIWVPKGSLEGNGVKADRFAVCDHPDFRFKPTPYREEATAKPSSASTAETSYFISSDEGEGETEATPSAGSEEEQGQATVLKLGRQEEISASGALREVHISGRRR
ncbi:uncharacterized protein PV07_12747, partial [Cladophialophora immunda]